VKKVSEVTFLDVNQEITKSNKK